MAADWEEVKRLAADFQRAQLSTSVQRLSERNWIEIVKKLIELKLIDVIFTNDGKEYITPKHLKKEILDELTVAGGRINLVSLANILNVDLSHIEARCHELVRADRNLQIVLGQLIDKSYVDSLAEEINDKLQQEGHLTFGEITKSYDLPPEFLEHVVHSRLGTIIKGNADPTDKRHIFTDSYLTQHKYRIRGILSAVTRPVQLSSLISTYELPEKLFYGIIEDLIKSSRLAGSLVGGRSEHAAYIPDIYSRAQNNWVDCCYRQNGYLEFDSLCRLGIQDVKNYIKRRFKDDNLVFLKSICVGPGILAQVEAALEEVVATGSWTDIMPLLPSMCTAEDGATIIQVVLKSRPKNSTPLHSLLDTIVVSDAFIDTCMHSFDALMTTKAELDAQKGVLFLESSTTVSTAHRHAAAAAVEEPTKQDRREERRKKATGGKSGGGTQGRETKTKSTKNKKRAGGRGRGEPDSDSDEGGTETTSKPKKQTELEFMTLKEVQDQLEKLPILKDCPKALSLSLAEKIHRPLTRKYQEVAKSIFLSSSSASGAARRKTHAELQEKLTALLVNVQQFDRGLKVLPEDLQNQLAKHLLKTLCTDIVNVIVGYLASEHGVAKETDVSSGITPEARQKLVQKLPDDIKGPVLKLHQSLSKTMEDFLTSVNVTLGPGICDMIIRSDKKKERQIMQNHRMSLLSQLGEASDPALCLHLTVLLVLQAQMQRMIHASGKFIPQLVAFLKEHLHADVHALLQQAQELVLKQLTLDDASEEKSEVASKLAEIMPRLKELGATYKRQSVSED